MDPLTLPLLGRDTASAAQYVPHVPPTPETAGLPGMAANTSKKETLRLLTQAEIIQRVAGSEPHATFTKRTDGSYGCSICEDRCYINLTFVNKHLRNMHHQRDRCTICNETFVVWRLLTGSGTAMAHVLSEHGEHERVTKALQSSPKKRAPRGCHPFFRTSLLRRLEPEATEATVVPLPGDRFGCSECPRINNRASDTVKNHIQRVHGKVREICGICQKQLSLNCGVKHINLQHSEDRRVMEALTLPTKNGRTRDLIADNHPDTPETATSPAPKNFSALLFQKNIIKKILYSDKAKIQQTEQGFVCSFCPNFIYSYLMLAKMHLQHQHSLQEREVCMICSEKLSVGDGASHVWTQHREEIAVRRALRPLPISSPQTPLSSRIYTFYSTTSQPTNAKPVRKENGSLSCSGCNKNFATSGSAKSHIKTVHQRIRLTCLLCKTNIGYRAQIGHLKRMHATDPDVQQIFSSAQH